jgi:uncharacterized membrane protein YhaH (DUF805 family)
MMSAGGQPSAQLTRSREVHVDWYLKVLKQYADFNGRARRKEYWMFVLFNFIIAVVLGIVAGIIRLPILTTIYSLAVLVPGIAVGVRRMHDIGKSGWVLLIGLIPLLGVILLIVWAAQEGNPGSNAYGPDPKNGASGVSAAVG